MDADNPPSQPRGTAPPELVAFLKGSYRPLMKAAMYAGASKDEAHDAVQDAFLKLVKRWGAISEPLPYVRRVMINNVKKAWLSRQRCADRQKKYQAMNFERPQDTPSIWDNRAAVEKILSELTPSQRDIACCLMEGLSQTEIAAQLGRSYDAVRTALTEMRKRLRVAGLGPIPTAENPDDAGRCGSEPSEREEDR
ncbi:RNA polymerase sigma factor [Micromonospora sp. HUAS LYJ1]|uniref:RNA polymerase sigma factor n=1 Tax=Micromonospora sp. HUAS LYJ1 TaxID=3061626 RepID=UPI00267141D4|nr:sigma-70 family RNA polymerase sigma factor [Micromonospora sp. HUAS LYJ1]WKU07286.1 sigma-70 family RNA polymerase sigma factor [Micromonospora sp. HUAS LYJ1]